MSLPEKIYPDDVCNAPKMNDAANRCDNMTGKSEWWCEEHLRTMDPNCVKQTISITRVCGDKKSNRNFEKFDCEELNLSIPTMDVDELNSAVKQLRWRESQASRCSQKRQRRQDLCFHPSRHDMSHKRPILILQEKIRICQRIKEAAVKRYEEIATEAQNVLEKVENGLDALSDDEGTASADPNLQVEEAQKQAQKQKKRKKKKKKKSAQAAEEDRVTQEDEDLYLATAKRARLTEEIMAHEDVAPFADRAPLFFMCFVMAALDGIFLRHKSIAGDYDNVFEYLLSGEVPDSYLEELLDDVERPTADLARKANRLVSIMF
jgi:hypothetical protein